MPHETAYTVVKFLQKYLGVTVEVRDIDDAHRIGTFLSLGNRSIICKFVTRLKKFEVIERRKELKGTYIAIKEDLKRNL